MAEKDTAKEEQVSDMDPSQTAESIPTPPEAGQHAALDPALQAHIGRQLRLVYDEVANEPVPDRFLKLLKELERDKADDS
jgi:hypothetical protein